MLYNEPWKHDVIDNFFDELTHAYCIEYLQSLGKRQNTHTVVKDKKLLNYFDNIFTEEYLKTNFSKVFTNIIEDFILLYNNRCNTNCGESNKPNIIFLYYFNGIIKILTKRGRIFYVGLFLLGISFMLYFIKLSE